MVLYGAVILSLLTVFGLTKPRGLLEETLQDLREVWRCEHDYEIQYQTRRPR